MEKSATKPWQVTVYTLFPQLFPGALGGALAGKALQEGLWSLDCVDMRSFGVGAYNRVDDRPFGGGAGMVLMPQVVDEALNARPQAKGPLLFLSPRGKRLEQSHIRDYTASSGLRLLCGRYEGIDQRVLDHHQVIEVSIGDYILSGGELAAMVLIDACVRLLPSVMGNGESGKDESFESGLLEYPHYTRPALWNDRAVPEVLLTGHHENIKAWQRNQAETLTQERRPDLWQRHQRTLKEENK